MQMLVLFCAGNTSHVTIVLVFPQNLYVTYGMKITSAKFSNLSNIMEKHIT